MIFYVKRMNMKFLLAFLWSLFLCLNAYAGNKNFSGFINICSNANCSFRFLINTLNSLTKSKINVISKSRSRQQVDQIMNNRFLKKIIGNYPFISIKKGLKNLIK